MIAFVFLSFVAACQTDNFYRLWSPNITNEFTFEFNPPQNNDWVIYSIANFQPNQLSKESESNFLDEAINRIVLETRPFSDEKVSISIQIRAVSSQYKSERIIEEFSVENIL